MLFGQVEAFWKQLHKAALPFATKEIGALTAYARSNGHVEPALKVWCALCVCS